MIEVLDCELAIESLMIYYNETLFISGSSGLL